MARPEVATDHARLTKLAREQAGLRPIVTTYERYGRAQHEMQSAHDMLRHEKDVEMQEFLRSEERRFAAQVGELEENLKVLLLPKDPNDDKDVDVDRPGRPEREHHLLRDPHHAPAHRHRRQHPGREVAAAEQGEGAASPTRASI